MRFGVCTSIENLEGLENAAKAGFDYVESRFAFFPESTDEEFEEAKNNLKKAGIKCEAANCFIPREFPISDSSCDRQGLAEYIEKGMKKGVEVGLKTIVLGSGGARKIPENVSYREAFCNISNILKEVIAPVAEKYDITIVLEPLRRAECNIINTVKEGVALAASCGEYNIQGLGDLFHMMKEGDTYDDIRDLKGSIKHAHLACPETRLYPKDINEFDYKGFIDALNYAGCERCSIEASTDDFNTEVFIAGKVIDELRKV